MGNLPGTDLPNHGKDPLVTSVFETGIQETDLALYSTN